MDKLLYMSLSIGFLTPAFIISHFVHVLRFLFMKIRTSLLILFNGFFVL